MTAVSALRRWYVGSVPENGARDRVLEALGINQEASEQDIADRLRELVDLTGPSTHADVWVCLLDRMVTAISVPFAAQISDMGHLAYAVAGELDLGDRGASWADELAELPDDPLALPETPVDAEDRLIRAFTDVVLPRLAAVGLTRAQPY